MSSDNNNGIGFNLFGEYEQSDAQCGMAGQCRPCGADPYGRATRCNTRGQCTIGGGNVELCVNTVEVSCRDNPSECENLKVYVQVEVGSFKDATRSVKGIYDAVAVGAPAKSVHDINDCIELDGEETRGRQVTVRVREGGFGGSLFGGGKIYGTCRTSVYGTSYRYDSGGDRNIAGDDSCGGRIPRLTVYMRSVSLY
jgi:hypothetical protein